MTIAETPIDPSIAPVVEQLPADPDIYRDVHKGIRAELFGATLQVGTLDVADRTGRLAVAQRYGALAGFLRQHAEHEEMGLQAAVEAYVPSLGERILHDHEALDARIADLAELALTVADTCGPSAGTAAHELYLESASFVSAYLEHQNLEERVVAPALLAAIGPMGMAELHLEILGAIGPQEMAEGLALMIPAMNVDERSALLGGMRAGAPAEVFAGVWGLVGTVLAPTDVAVLATRLGLA